MARQRQARRVSRATTRTSARRTTASTRQQKETIIIQAKRGCTNTKLRRLQQTTTPVDIGNYTLFITQADRTQRKQLAGNPCVVRILTVDQIQREYEHLPSEAKKRLAEQIRSRAITPAVADALHLPAGRPQPKQTWMSSLSNTVSSLFTIRRGDKQKAERSPTSVVPRAAPAGKKHERSPPASQGESRKDNEPAEARRPPLPQTIKPFGEWRSRLESLRSSFSSLLQPKEKKAHYPTISLKEPRGIIPIPAFGSVHEVNARYPLIEPFASAHISWDPQEKKLLYRIVEPALTEKEQKMISEIEENLMDIIDIKMTAIKKTEKLIDYLKEKVSIIMEDMGVSPSSASYTKMMYYIFRNFVGLNEIEPLMHDPYIEDVGCTGLYTPIYVIHRRFGSIETTIVYNNPTYLANFVIKMSERCGRYISYATPLLDGSLPDGSRVQASLAKDVTTKGPTFTIRKFRRNPYSPTDIINMRTANAALMAYLWFLVQYNTSMLICGGVSSGKTTFLNLLSMFIPPEEKIISIEDTRELNLTHKNWIPAAARTGFGVPDVTGKRYGEVDLFDLLKESFRQNPSYVIVGEIRGKEAYVMFQGMSSGHPSLGTMHAGSIEDVMKRLETPPIELSASLIESLDVVIVMVNAREKGEDARRVKEVVEVQSVDAHTGVAHYKKIFAWIPSTDSFKENIEESELIRRVVFREGLSYASVRADLRDRELFINWLVHYDIVEYDQFSALVNMFYKDKDAMIELVRSNQNPKKLLSYPSAIPEINKNG